MITIQTPTPDSLESRRFYEKLKFTEVSKAPNQLFTDGQVLIEINTNRYARAGIRFHRSSWQQELERLRTITVVHQFPDYHLLSDGNGCWIYLLESKSTETIAPIGELPNSILGSYAGVSLETTDLSRSIDIWSALGFELQERAKNNAYVTLINKDDFRITIMQPNNCPHLFPSMSITYFNGANNAWHIEQVREANVPLAEEITHFNKENKVDNLLLRDPGGLGIFVFND
ncbi:MAG: hypothetical protein AAF789_02230 [Bacteroidota bacterium]